MDRYMKHIHNNMFNTVQGRKATQYLLDRGLTMESIKEFHIGLVFGKKVEEKLLFTNFDFYKSVGLVHSEKGTAVFTNRIMIPLLNEDGYVVGFIGRTLQDLADWYQTPFTHRLFKMFNEKGIKSVKYTNTIETAYFKKSDFLFNLNAYDSNKTKWVTLTESQLNAVALAQMSGTSHPLGQSGVELTDWHLSALKRRGVGYATICYDGDFAGYENSMKSSIKLYKAGIENDVVIMPKNKDVMDLLPHTKRLKKVLISARYGIEYLIDYELSKIEDTMISAKERAVERIAKDIIPSFIKYDFYPTILGHNEKNIPYHKYFIELYEKELAKETVEFNNDIDFEKYQDPKSID